jgi:hypothetical protein
VIRRKQFRIEKSHELGSDVPSGHKSAGTIRDQSLFRSSVH